MNTEVRHIQFRMLVEDLGDIGKFVLIEDGRQGLHLVDPSRQKGCVLIGYEPERDPYYREHLAEARRSYESAGARVISEEVDHATRFAGFSWETAA